MKRIASVCLFLLLGCAVGPRYHFSEGPPRLKLTAPRTANTNQIFLIKGVIEGDQTQIPFGELVGIEIKANDILLGRSVLPLSSRYLTVQAQMTADFYMMFSARSPRRSPMDFDEVDPVGGMLPIEEDPDAMDLDVTLEVSVVLLEINYKNEVVPLDVLFHKDHHLKLSCNEMMCAPY